MTRSRMRSQSDKQRARQKNLAAIKADILPRCRMRCELPVCRRLKPLDLAHVTSRAQGAPEVVDTKDNTLCLCRPHHRMVDVTRDIKVEAKGGEFFNIEVHEPDGRTLWMTYQRPAA